MNPFRHIYHFLFDDRTFLPTAFVTWYGLRVAFENLFVGNYGVSILAAFVILNVNLVYLTKT